MKIELSANLIPDSRLKDEIWNLMKKISTKYGTCHDIKKKFGAHITVVGFENIDEKNLQKIVNEIKLICSKTKPFEVKIGKINFAENNRQKYQTQYVIYLEVIRSSVLSKLNKILNNKIKKYGKPKLRYFVPHVTLAHGDLNKENYYRAKRELEAVILRKFIARSLKIMILKEPKKWVHVKTFKFAAY